MPSDYFMVKNEASGRWERHRESAAEQFIRAVPKLLVPILVIAAVIAAGNV